MKKKKLQRNLDIGDKKNLKINLFKIKNINFFFKNSSSNLVDNNIKKINQKKIKKIRFKKINFSNKKKGVFKILESMKHELKEQLFDVIIHGSYGDDTYIKNWSDIDCLIIIKDNIFCNKKKLILLKKKLINFQKKIYKLFPLQHHGFQFITEEFLNNYDESIMTTKAFLKSKTFYNEVIKFRTIDRNFNYEILKNRFKYIKESMKTKKYLHHGKNKKYLDITFSNKNRLYQLFAYMNYLLLIPSLFLGAINKSVHKADSFKKIKKEISQKDLELINRLTNIRKKWDYNKRDIKKNYITKQLISELKSNFFEQSYNFEKKILIKLNKLKYERF